MARQLFEFLVYMAAMSLVRQELEMKQSGTSI